MKKKILVCCLSDPNNNPRPNRAIKYFLEKKIDLWIVSYPTKNKIVDNHYFIPDYNKKNIFLIKGIKFLLSFFVKRFLKKSDWHRINDIRFNLNKVLPDIKGQSFDYILVEDLNLLPFILKNFKSSKIVFDAREYFPKEFESNLLFRIFESKERLYYCQKYFPQCFKIITISKTFSKLFFDEFKVKAEVVLSAPVYLDLDPGRVDENNIKIVHHGAANYDRKLENLIEIVQKLPRQYSLDLVLVGNKKYIDKLRKLIKTENIKIIKPWNYDEIVSNLNKYDIGFFYVEPTTFNLKYGLPNKFFEYIQARLAIVIGPSPEMVKYLKLYNCGVFSEEFNLHEMEKTILNLSPKDIMGMKLNSNIAAKVLNAENQLSVFDKIFV